VSNTKAAAAASAYRARGNRGNALLRAAVLVGALSGVTAIAQADTAKTPDGPLTWNGITLYGAVDIGFQYQSHGVPVSDYFPAGTEELIQKNSNGSVATINGSNLSQSKIGVQGREEFGNGWAGVFKLETFFNPWSGHISDALKSLTQNNGRDVASNSQNTGVDSSIAGQFFGGAAYGGLTNAQFGTITFGRQNSVLADGVAKYDPMGASQAFSLLGFSGTYGGGGVTEDRRLDSSVKYDLTAGSVHFGAQFQPKTSSNPGTTQAFVLGFNFPGGSVDAYYMQKNDAISAAALTAAQFANVGKVCAGTAVAGYACAAPDRALAGTVSDNTATSIMGKYSFANKATVFAGYEHIEYQNPSTPVAPGQVVIGGYTLAFVNNGAYASLTAASKKTVGVVWAGLKYPVTPQLEMTGAYYYYSQNSYAVGANAGCSKAAVSGQCSGSFNGASFVADYRFTKRFDIYAGAWWNQVQGGPANGFLFATATIDPTIGIRYTF
jgi:predicted porin